MNAAPPYQPLIRLVGLDAEAVFTHPDVTVWRDLPDRQNATLDFTDTDGRLHRWHVKRYPAKYAKQANAEVRGLHLLRQAGIRTPDLVAHGTLPDGRSFLITDDLAGHRPAEKFLAAGGDFAAILPGTAAVAARLHHAGLHHRDLYLNHFFIDAADPAREP
ncbi:MAG: lipopolysaccharide kinase InaA family protein, partial [Phycisphaerae bacterium]